MTIRAKLLTPHRWLGLAFAILLFVQGCTGVVVAFRDELNQALHHAALTVVPATAKVPVQALADRVRAAHPQLRLERIEYPEHVDAALVFRMQAADGGDLRFVAVNPHTGAITRDEPVSGWPVQWLYKVHQQLLAGDTGHIIVGISAIALLFFAITGLWMWWPGRRHLRRGLTVSFSNGAYRGFRDAHRVGGALAGSVLFMSACTGIVLVWFSSFQSFAGMFGAVARKPSASVVERSGASLLPIDAVIERARERFGDAPIKSVRFPGLHGRVVSVYFVDVGNSRPRATNQIMLNGYSGETLHTYEAAKAPAANRTLDWVLPVHTGEFLGFPGRILLLLAAVALQALAITGLLQWWQRRQRRRTVTGQ